MTTAESAGGGDACSFSPPLVDRTHHSPGSGKRRMSDEEQQEDAKQPKSPKREDVQQAEQHGNGGEGGDEKERVRVPLRMHLPKYYWNMTDEEWQQYLGRERAFRQSQAAGHGEGGLGLAKGDG